STTWCVVSSGAFSAAKCLTGCAPLWTSSAQVRPNSNGSYHRATALFSLQSTSTGAADTANSAPRLDELKNSETLAMDHGDFLHLRIDGASENRIRLRPAPIR